MSAEDGIQIQIQAEDEFSDTFSSAQESLSEFSNSISEVSSSESDFASSTSEATDATNSLTEAQTEAANATSNLNESTQSMGASFSEGADSIKNVGATMVMGTTAAIGLGDAMMNAEDAARKLTDAHNNLIKAQDAVTNDQEKLALAQQKLTALQDSGHATASQLASAQQAVANAENTLQNAQLSLATAQNNYANAQDRVTKSNEQVMVQTMEMGAVLIPELFAKGPELIAFLTGWGAEEDALTASQLAQSAASGIASGAMALFDAVMDANPIVLVVLAIGGLVAALAYLTDGFKNFGPLEADFNKAWQDLQVVFNDVVGFIKSDVYPVLDELYKIYIQPIISAIDTISNIGNSISKGVSSIGKGIGSLIPGLATGGIIDQPMLAMIGEEGPEAVVPLSSATLTTPSGFQALPSINPQSNSTSNSIRTATINIQQDNNIASNVDVNAMTQDLANKIAQRLELGY